MFALAHNSKSICFAVTFLSALLVSVPIAAQTSSDLLAPYYHCNLQTACIEFEDNTFRLIRSNTEIQTRSVSDDHDDDGSVEVMKVKESDLEVADDGSGVMTQKYTVKVPYTEVVEVDGKQIAMTKVREETRTRQLRVEDAENSKIVEYEIGVPTTVVVNNARGESQQMTTIKPEKRTRMIGKDEELIRRKVSTSTELKAGLFKFYKIDGTTVTNEQAAKLIVERQPVIVLAKDEPIVDEYYQSLLSPRILMVFVEADKPETDR